MVAMTSASDEKWRHFNCFSVQGTGISPTGPDLEKRVGDQDIGRPVSSGLQVPGNYLDRAQKIPNLFRRLAPLTFLIRVQAFRDPLRGELPHVQIFMNDRPNPLT